MHCEERFHAIVILLAIHCRSRLPAILVGQTGEVLVDRPSLVEDEVRVVAKVLIVCWTIGDPKASAGEDFMSTESLGTTGKGAGILTASGGAKFYCQQSSHVDPQDGRIHP